jgi:hypothetical protein
MNPPLDDNLKKMKTDAAAPAASVAPDPDVMMDW